MVFNFHVLLDKTKNKLKRARLKIIDSNIIAGGAEEASQEDNRQDWSLGWSTFLTLLTMHTIRSQRVHSITGSVHGNDHVSASSSPRAYFSSFSSSPSPAAPLRLLFLLRNPIHFMAEGKWRAHHAVHSSRNILAKRDVAARQAVYACKCVIYQRTNSARATHNHHASLLKYSSHFTYLV